MVISGNLFAGKPGSHLLAANGGTRVKMYAPNPWRPGSSVSHWDWSVTYFPNFMRHAYASPLHTFNTRKIGIMRDMGWETCDITISGPSTVCQQATYQIENLTEGAQINWTTSNSLSISNGQGTPQVTVSNTGAFSISHFVKATITACGSSYEICKNISRVGNESALILLYDADGINSYHAGTILTRHLIKAHLNNPSPDPNHYRWTIIAPPKSNIPNKLASGQSFSYATDYVGNYTFRLTYFAECGWSTITRDIYFGFGSLMQVKILPNPASNETSVSLNLNSGEDLNSMSSQIWEFEVHDQNQRLITHQRNIKSNSHTINTAGWQKGLYIVTVKYNNETFSEKLVVK
ncbi:hypothetical protein CDL62_03275 [Alkalitalea saponilacus]|nr:hypothetical protein CDL62_03275 [Alkalitalea saponilacus]